MEDFEREREGRSFEASIVITAVGMGMTDVWENLR
jgi:hypothetical protein